MKKKSEGHRGGSPTWVYLALRLLRVVIELLGSLDDGHGWW